MHFLSTRGGVAPTKLSDAILAGLAPDGGLYVPSAVARLAPAGAGLAGAAHAAIAPYFEGDALAAHLPAMIEEAYAFDAPLRATAQPGAYVLELFHGPTAAFKDFGARFLAACLARLHGAGAGELTVLVATSGDTGAAVAAAFHNKPGVRVIILYPDGLVSPRQAHQLGAFGDNVAALRVAGRFDDCQRMVKQAFADTALRQQAPLASANSISLGRLLPQMAYYVHAARTHAARAEGLLNFAVPTGNLGNAFACLLARAMGAPIGDVMLASNSNRTLSDYLSSGAYEGRESVATLANAMDVGDPSNVERLNWLFPGIEALRAGVSAESVDDDAIRARIREGEARYGAIWCPHTACAIEAIERRRRAGDQRPWCAAATAHPAKFESIVEPLIGRAVEAPPALAAMLARPSHAEPLEGAYAALRARILAR